MLVKLLQNLGSDDVRACNAKHQTQLDAAKCKSGETIDLPDAAVSFFAAKYPPDEKGNFGWHEKVKGEAKIAK